MLALGQILADGENVYHLICFIVLMFLKYNFKQKLHEYHFLSSWNIVFCSGYLAPEYALGGQLTLKADVYSFGVLILELVSGKRSSTVFGVEISILLLGRVSLLISKFIASFVLVYLLFRSTGTSLLNLAVGLGVQHILMTHLKYVNLFILVLSLEFLSIEWLCHALNLLKEMLNRSISMTDAIFFCAFTHMEYLFYFCTGYLVAYYHR